MSGAQIITPATPRLPYVEPFNPDLTGSIAFAYSAGTLNIQHVRFLQPIRFKTVYIQVETAAGDVEATVWTNDGTNINRVATSGAVTAAGTSALQGLDLGSFFTPVLGVDYWIGIGNSLNTLRILSGANATTDTARALTPFGDGNIGRRRKISSVTPPASTSYAISGFVGVTSDAQPFPWFALVDGV